MDDRHRSQAEGGRAGDPPHPDPGEQGAIHRQHRGAVLRKIESLALNEHQNLTAILLAVGRGRKLS